MVSQPPLIAYFGHHKCATQWITAILSDICATTHLRLFEVSQMDTWDFANLRDLIRCFRPDVLAYSNAEISQVKLLPPLRGFHVVRDPRDLIVSAYYSHLHSHSIDTWPGLAEHRRHLQAVDMSQGLLLEMEFSRRVLTEMAEWDYCQPAVLEVRMEDLTASPVDQFTRIVEHLGLTNLPESSLRERLGSLVAILLGRTRRMARRHLAGRASLPAPVLPADLQPAAASSSRPDPYRFYPVDGAWKNGLRSRSLPREEVPLVVERHNFARKAGGRDRGVEDRSNHYRKGVAGDWRNHFEPIHIDSFKRNYNALLLKLAYETDPHWV